MVNPKHDTRQTPKLDTLNLNFPVYGRNISKCDSKPIIQKYVDLLHLYIIHKVQHRKQFQSLSLRRTSILFVNDMILYPLWNITRKLWNIIQYLFKKFFFSFYFYLTRNCKPTLNFLVLACSLFTYNRSLWDHCIGIPSFYSILFYSPSRWNFLNHTSFVSYFDSGASLMNLKGALSETIFAIEIPLKMMKNAYFTSLALFVLKIFKFLSWRFGHLAKQLD